MKVRLVCHSLEEIVLTVLRAYSTDCPLAGADTVLIVILLCVLLDSVGGDTDAPAPLAMATALAVTVPVIVIALVASVTLRAGILVGSLTGLVLASYVVGVPVIGTVTTVLLVRSALPTVKPGGRFGSLTEKSAGEIVETYVPLDRVYTMLALLAS